MKFRPDIEGLRALAVTLVVLSHLGISSFSGGYVGVDIFFVISGYLITGLISHEYATRATQNDGFGWFSLRGFYLRRVKRIIPMSLLVLVATSIAGYFLFNSVRADRISNDAIWAGLFAANIHFINQATDYFQQGFSTSPLQHYWSLAVEEQFYLVFPALFLFAVKRHGITIFNIKLWWERRVGVLISAVIFLSFIWSIYQTSAHPLNAYFSSLTRAWELGIGALLAIATLRSKDRFSEDSKSIIGIAGLVMILASVFFFNSQTSFPGFAALIPVIGSALIIFSGIHSTNLVSDLLSIRIFTFLGRISYSIYLWHWPVIIFANSTHPDFLKHPFGKVLAVLLVLLLSTASYYLVENPIRSIKISKKWTEPARRIENDKEGRYNIKVSRFAILSWVGVIITVALVIIVLTEKPQGSSLSQSTNSSTSVTANEQLPVVEIHNFPGIGTPIISANSYKKSLSAWQQEVAAGNKLKELPRNLTPSLANLPNNWKPASLFTEHVPFGAKKRAYIFGDSTAQRIPYLLTWNLDPAIWSIQMRSFPGCDLGGVTKVGPNNFDCQKNMANFFSELKRKKADLILVTEQNKWFANDSASTSASNPRVKGLISTIDFIGKHTKKLIFLGSMPTSKGGLIECLKNKATLNGDCFSSVNSIHLVTKMEASITKNAGGVFADSTQWLCNAGTCPPIIKNQPVMIDAQHISDAMSVTFSQIFGKWLWSQPWAGSALTYKVAAPSRSILNQNSENSPGVVNKTPPVSYSKLLSSQSAAIRSGIDLKVMPSTVKPAFSEVSSTKFWNQISNCSPSDLGNSCSAGRGRKQVLVIGDSHARMINEMVKNSYDLTQYTVIGRYVGFCKFSFANPWDGHKELSKCTDFLNASIKWIKENRPDTVIISAADEGILAQNGKPLDRSAGQKVFEKGLDSALSEISGFTRHLIYFGQTPYSKPILECVDAKMHIDSTCFAAAKSVSAIHKVEMKYAQKYRGTFIDPTAWMCDSVTCPPIINNLLVRLDGGHLTDQFASSLAPIFSAYLSKLGLKDLAPTNPIASSQRSAMPTVSFDSVFREWKSKINSGLELSNIPKNLQPPFSDVAGIDIFKKSPCPRAHLSIFGSKSNSTQCLSGTGSKRALILGNSHAWMFDNLIRTILVPQGYEVLGYYKGSCTVTSLIPVVNSAPIEECANYYKGIRDFLKLNKVDLIIVSEKEPLSIKIGSQGASYLDTQKLFWASYKKEISFLASESKHLLVIGETPSLKQPALNCVDRNGAIDKSCSFTESQSVKVFREQEYLASKSANSKYLNIADWLCSGYICPLVIDNSLVFADSNHVTDALSLKLVPLMSAYLTENRLV